MENPLRRRVIDDMTLRNLSSAMQRSHLHAVTKFRRYFGRSLDRLGLEDVRGRDCNIDLLIDGLQEEPRGLPCELKFVAGSRQHLPVTRGEQSTILSKEAIILHGLQ
ncbi:hypothetical protein J2Z50_006651 [Ensifer mexicanus]|nr:hypothetical protein [Sinorhizobium mexicanum]